MSRDLHADVMETWAQWSCHLPCVSWGKAVEASSRSHQVSSCEIDPKQSSAGSCRQGSPETSCSKPEQVKHSRHSRCRITCGAEERRCVLPVVGRSEAAVGAQGLAGVQLHAAGEREFRVQIVNLRA